MLWDSIMNSPVLIATITLQSTGKTFRKVRGYKDIVLKLSFILILNKWDKQLWSSTISERGAKIEIDTLNHEFYLHAEHTITLLQ